LGPLLLLLRLLPLLPLPCDITANLRGGAMRTRRGASQAPPPDAAPAAAAVAAPGRRMRRTHKTTASTFAATRARAAGGAEAGRTANTSTGGGASVPLADTAAARAYAALSHAQICSRVAAHELSMRMTTWPLTRLGYTPGRGGAAAIADCDGAGAVVVGADDRPAGNASGAVDGISTRAPALIALRPLPTTRGWASESCTPVWIGGTWVR
jgi:hypothetical protein